MGDVTLSLSFSAFNKTSSSLSITGGVKIPTNDADISKNNLPLPMVYQTSLGSTDILLGAKYVFRKWDFTCGYQHSFNANKNAYLHKATTTENALYNGYFESNKMRRADDGIFRVIRNFKIKKAVTSAGLLFIYHLSNDKIENAAGNRVEATGSEGLTLNMNLSGVVPLTKNIDFTFVFGTPFITREYRTDGLTRHFIIVAGLQFNLFKEVQVGKRE